MPPSSKTVQADETVATPAPSTYTKWEAFSKANLQVSAIKCEGYQPTHIVNLGCHTNLVTKPESITSHIAGDHGGGFVFSVRQSDGKPWAGWNELKALGLELSDFRCAHCQKEIPLHPQHILAHLKPHPGVLRRSASNDKLALTITTSRPIPTEDDAYSDF